MSKYVIPALLPSKYVDLNDAKLEEGLYNDDDDVLIHDDQSSSASWFSSLFSSLSRLFSSLWSSVSAQPVIIDNGDMNPLMEEQQEQDTSNETGILPTLCCCFYSDCCMEDDDEVNEEVKVDYTPLDADAIILEKFRALGLI